MGSANLYSKWVGKMWVFLFALFSVCAAQESGLFELNIVHYNDFHAHFDEVTTQGTVCTNPSEGTCIGGFARLYTAISQAMEVEPDSLLLNGGDTFQGTIWYNFLRWNVSLHFMNMLPHDAHVLGNHEFDHDIPGIVPYLQGLNSVMLGANVNSTLEPRMQGLYQNHVVIERHGRRIGIIGVLLRTFSAPIGNLIMEDELDAVNREAAILTQQGVDIIIVLSHCGFDCDKRIAERATSDIDVIVGGHSHTLLYSGETPNGDTPVDDYPTVVTQSNGHRIPIVQASCYTRYLGIIKLFIDEAGRVQGWEGQPVYLGTSIVKDPQIEALLQPWRDEVDAVGKEVLGTSLVTLNRSWCSSGECNLGSFACDAFLDEMLSRAQGTAWNYVNVCLINSGGLRVQINPGEVTTESLLMAMPFENYVQVYDLRGEHLLEALEFSVGTFQATPGSFSSGRMLQIGGLRVVYNASSAVGSRVQSALVRCIDCDVPKYEPLDVNAVYKIITQNYIGDGGGGYTVLSENRFNLETLEVDYVMLQNYMRRLGTVIRDLDGRIQVVF